MRVTTNQFTASKLGLKVMVTCFALFLGQSCFGQQAQDEFKIPESTLDSLSGQSNPNSSGSSYLHYSLLGFNVKNDEREAVIEWSTFYEMDQVFFAVERTLDLIQWEVVHQCQGVGVSSGISDYTSVDSNPHFGNSYYRLRIVDINGVISYSTIKSFSMNDNQSKGLMAYPNPANSFLMVSGTTKDIESLTVHDVHGQDVSEHVQLIWGDPHHVEIDISDLRKGHYFVKTTAEMVKIWKL